MDRKKGGQAARKAADTTSQSSFIPELSCSPQHAAAVHSSQQMPITKHAGDLLPLSTAPTMRTASVDTDSASVSASTSPATTSPTAHTSPSPPDSKPASHHLQVALKILVSNSASGLIIGRSGSTISDLQAKSQTRIKLSQGGDYYPGTSDRVCLIQGSLTNASVAVKLVLAKLYELQSFQQLASKPPPAGQVSPSDSQPEHNASTTFIVRLLVPSTCCGMIIGRGGSNIKSLKEKSEVTYIQLSPKEHEVMVGGSSLSTSERIMTITGPNFTSCFNCVRIILNDMGQNPEISRYINMTTSYSKNLATAPGSYTVAPSPGFFLEQETFQQHVISQPPHLETPPRYGMGEQFMQGQFSASSPGAGLQGQPEHTVGLLRQQLLSHQGPSSEYESIAHGDMPLPLIGDPSTMMQQQPFDQSAMSSPPRNVDSSANTSSPYNYVPPYQQSQAGQTAQFWSPGVTTGSPGRNILPSPSGDLSVEQLTQSFQSQTSLPRHPSHLSLQQHIAGSKTVSVQLGVPDTRIGSILGRGGKTLTEIQSLSQTKIRISQRGEFIPGTHNRAVTITGNSTQDVEHAQHLLNQRLTASFARPSSSSELRQLKDG